MNSKKLEIEGKALRKIITQSDIAFATKTQEIDETEHWLASNIKGAGKAYYSEKELLLDQLKAAVHKLKCSQTACRKKPSRCGRCKGNTYRQNSPLTAF